MIKAGGVHMKTTEDFFDIIDFPSAWSKTPDFQSGDLGLIA